MSNKKNRHEYYRGKHGVKYGIYNTVEKCFQFGIREDTPMLAEARLFQKIGDDARKWRFEARALPADGLRANVCLIDEMHELKPTEMLPPANKASVHLYYSKEEAALLFDLLHAKMKDLMSINIRAKLKGKPILNQEEQDYLHRVMKFAAEQMKALAKYANVGGIEG